VIGAMSRSDATRRVSSGWGKPFSVKGFGAQLRNVCGRASVLKSHGHELRQATIERMGGFKTRRSSSR